MVQALLSDGCRNVRAQKAVLRSRSCAVVGHVCGRRRSQDAGVHRLPEAQRVHLRARIASSAISVICESHRMMRMD